MQDAELHHREPSHPGGSSRSVEMVVVGHVGLATVQTPDDKRTSPGGSGYAVAASAAALIGGRVGLVAQVGRDFELTTPLRHLGVNLDGVTELPGTSAKLRIDQFDDGTCSFSSELGVAATVRLDSFPASYLHAAYIHLGTAPPEQQLTWLQFLHDRGCTAQISADMFEHYVAKKPDASREVCDNANLIFMNEAEYDGLYGHGQGPAPKAPMILKRGSAGASLCADGLTRDVSAPEAHVVRSHRRRGDTCRCIPRPACRRPVGCPLAGIRGTGGCQLRGRIRGAWTAPHRSARGHPPRGAPRTFRLETLSRTLQPFADLLWCTEAAASYHQTLELAPTGS